MKRIYVAHPFGGKESNKSTVEGIIKELVKTNPDYLFISPIHVFGYLYEDVDYQQGMDYCFELLKTCDYLLLCGDWKSSRGCKMEKEFAEENKMWIGFL